MAEAHRTVHRIAGILETVARAHGNGVSLGALAEQLQTPRSTIHGLVQGLLHEGYLVENDHAFSLGSGIHAVLGSSDRSLELLLTEVCDEIALRTGETVTVAVPVGAESISYIYSVPSAFEVSYVPRMNIRRPSLPRSSGKLLLALDDALFDRYSATGEQNARRAETFQREEAQPIREARVAYNFGETVAEVGGVATAVTIEDQVVAAVSIAGPRSRTEPELEHFGELAKQVLGAAGF